MILTSLTPRMKQHIIIDSRKLYFPMNFLKCSFKVWAYLCIKSQFNNSSHKENCICTSFLISSHSALAHIPVIKATGGPDQTISTERMLRIVIL